MVAFLSMFFPVSTFAALCVFIEVSDGSRASDNELDTVFRERYQFTLLECDKFYSFRLKDVALKRKLIFLFLLNK